MLPDIVERAAIGVGRERGRLARPDHFAAKTEPAIHRADVNHLEQHPIGIAMHDAGDRRMPVIANRLGPLPRLPPPSLTPLNPLPQRRAFPSMACMNRRCYTAASVNSPNPLASSTPQA